MSQLSIELAIYDIGELKLPVFFTPDLVARSAGVLSLKGWAPLGSTRVQYGAVSKNF